MRTMERWATLLLVGLCSVSACSDPPPGRTYFERNIQPILEQKCVGNTSGCHATNTGDVFELAAGNLDVTSFENIQKRRDTLSPFGAYPFPLFLIKAVGPGVLKMQYGDTFRNIDVQHVGGGIIEVGSDAYFTLLNWLENGATENGLKPATPPQQGDGDCSTAVPADFDRARFINATTQPRLDEFRQVIQPILTAKGCGAGSCHGAPQSDFYITCGTDQAQAEFNFSQAWSFVNNPVDDSQLLRVPLAVKSGGRGHTGGDQFDLDDTEYKALRTWANAIGKLEFANGDPAKQFFEDHVQPVLLTRGCSFQACHSPQAGNDFKLRSGAIGFFSAVALEKNYELLKHDFMAFEFPDARRGRAVAKTILEDDPRVAGDVGGIVHRGGPVLETAGDDPSDPAACGTFNAMTSNAFCTIQEWVRLERAALGGEVTPMGAGDTVEIVYVDRTTPPTAGRLEFDTFQGGADLRIVATTVDGSGTVQPVGEGGSQSLLGNCAGLTSGTADVQAPDVSHDGNRIAFAARNSANEPLGVFVVDRNGTTCTRVTPAAADANGLKVHNFDPAWSPDGNHLVFASTRGKPADGPRRSRKRGLPQSDLWRVAMSGLTADQGSYEQMTVLSNSEISPQFMREGRVTMTTEKASDGFYQLAGRRINWDLTDYHPLLGQRKDSLFVGGGDMTTLAPSIGYDAVTDIREGSDGNFLIVLSNVTSTGAPTTPGGAGALATFNRSIGPFDKMRDGQTGFLSSVRVLDAAEGYRTPSSLPDGQILVSYASNPGSGNFGVYAYNPRTLTRTQLVTGGGIHVDAQLVYRYPARKLYNNRRQLVFGGNASGDRASANLHVLDAPMLFTLLTSNLRRGRPVDAFRRATHIEFLSEGLCPTGTCTPNTNGVYESRTSLGKVRLADDGSVRAALPAQTGVVMRLVDDSGATVVTMTEEHQMGPGENISMGVPESLFDAVCGGCHGSITGSELDVIVTPDALTGASRSISANQAPVAPR